MGKDIYKYFRIEAEELLEGLSRGIVDLETGRAGGDCVGRLLRLAHTLKGAARVVNQLRISELAHHIEDILAPHRDDQQPLTRDRITRLLELVGGCESLLEPLKAALQTDSTAAPRRQADEPITSVRIEVSDMDAVLHDLGEAGVQLDALRREIASLETTAHTARAVADLLSVRRNGQARTRAVSLAVQATEANSLAEKVDSALRHSRRALQIGIERAERSLLGVRNRASEFRLMPVDAVFGMLERATRDAAESLHKRVTFETSGGGQRLDAHVLFALRDALIHVVRNAVAHGIETETQRVAAGKPPAGHVRLRVRRTGRRVTFTVEDDGRGIDVAAIHGAAVRRGLMGAADAQTLDLAAATRLLFQGGVTTSAELSELSGRGVGLNAVRTTVQGLQGSIDLRSAPGRGTTVEITVPVSIESMTVLEVAAGERKVLLPLEAVYHMLCVPRSQLSDSGDTAMLTLADRAIPFRTLGGILGQRKSSTYSARSWATVVLKVGESYAAVGVDSLGGIRSAIVRPLPAQCGSLPLVAGATLDGAGNPELVLDPAGLAAAVRMGEGVRANSAVRPQPPVLVVDDSLTTRMLEQNVLEAAGYQVDVATSGEEAIEVARTKDYALFVVDVEMPGMNGFELIERFRGDPLTHAIPAILVTSRSSAEDRNRGERAGASAYMVKSEFDEKRLLRTIRELITDTAP